MTGENALKDGPDGCLKNASNESKRNNFDNGSEY